MADDNTFPPVPAPESPAVVAVPTQAQTEAWNMFDRQVAAAGVSLEGVGGISGAVNIAFTTIDSTLKRSGLSFDNLATSTTKASQQTALLTTAILGAREAFTQINGIDTSRLLTSTEQLVELRDIIRAGPGTSLFVGALDAITSGMARLGASTEVIKKTQEEAKKGVISTAAAFFTSADNIKRLQNSMIEATVSGSGLNELLKVVGDDFEKLDQVNERYAGTLNKITKELGGTKKAQEQAAHFMAMVSSMPGGLRLLTQELEVNGEKFDVLADTMSIAAASSRKQEEVLKDVNTVLQGYKGVLADVGESTKAATDFTASMATMTSNLSANINDVHSALMESASAFKMFVMDGADAAAMTKGMSSAMESYVTNLEAVGVPAANAIEMFKNYTNVVKNMTLGQMSFISSMSGGPGGLRGAFQMQDAMSKGNFEEIRKQIETTIKRQTGPLLSREQAMQSESGAAQYTRQLQMIQQGPLGSLAKTLPEAEAVLKAMRDGGKLPAQAALRAENPQKDANELMKAGQKIQKDSHGVLVDINASLNTIVMQSGLANRRTEKQLLGTGNPGSLGGGTDGSGRGVSVLPNGVNVPSSGDLAKVANVFQDLPQTVKNAWNNVKDVMGSGDKVTIQRANEQMLNAIKESKERGGLNDQQKAALTIAQQSFASTRTSQTAPTTAVAPTTGTTRTTTGTTLAPSPPTTAKATFAPAPGTSTRPGAHMPPPLQPAATGTTGTPGARAAGTGGGTNVGPGNGQPTPVTLAPGSAITVNFTGACPHCGNNVRSSTNGVVAPQADHKH